MAKIGIFKKIAALATVIALVICFAVSASAAVTIDAYSSTYGADGEISVFGTISCDEGEFTGKSVSIYATKGDKVIYIDQIDNADDVNEFAFIASEDDLNGEIKVGYTDAGAASTTTIGATTVKLVNDTKVFPNMPADEDGNPLKAITVTFDVADQVKDVTVESGNATVSSKTWIEGVLTVTLTDLTYDDETGVLQNIELDYTIDENATPTANLIDAALIKDEETGEMKLTAISRALNSKEYGIKVNDEGYKAMGKTKKGYYAVQIITDDSEVLDETATYTVSAYSGEVVSNSETVSVQ